MKTLALDTNAYQGFKRGRVEVLGQLGRAERILIPVPVLTELRTGFLGGSKEARYLDELGSSSIVPEWSYAPFVNADLIVPTRAAGPRALLPFISLKQGA
jgi:hypothetical protein